MKNVIKIAALIVGMIFFSVICVSAGDLTIPNTFVADEPAVAAEVNANFNAVKTEVDDNNTRIISNEGDIGSNSNAIGDNIADISANTTAIAANDNDISNNRTAILANEADISTLDGIVADNEMKLPAIKQSPSDSWEQIPDESGFGTVDSIQITPPDDGYALVIANGTILITHNTATLEKYCLDLSDQADYIGGCVPMAGSRSAIRGNISSNYPTSSSEIGIPYTLMESFPVLGGTTYTFYLSGYTTSGEDWLFHPTMTVLYTPFAMP